MAITAQNTTLKPGYKQTEVGVIPEDWEERAFKTLYSESSRNGIYKTVEFQGRGTRIVNMGEMFGFEFISNQEMSRVVLTSKELALFGLQNRDLLFGRRSVVPAGAGKCSIVVALREPLTFESSIIRVRLNLKEANPLFYYYFFASQIGRSVMSAIVSGTNVKGIRASELKELKVPILSFIEQSAIAAVLSDIDTLIERLDKLIAKKKAIKQAVMQQLLTGKTRLPGFAGDDHAKLGDFFELNPNKTYLSDTDLVTFIRMEDISESGNIINQNIMPVSSIKRGLTFFERNDVLVAKITPCFENGKGACLDTIETKSGFGSTEFHVLRAKKKAIPRYIFYQTQTVEFRRRLEAEMIGTAGQKRVPARAIINYSLPVLHSIDEQQAIVTILSDMDAEIVFLEQKRDKTRALKKGMMQELLTGKTRLL